MYFRKVVVFMLMFVLLQTLQAADKYATEIFKMGAGVRNFSLGRAGLTDDQTTAPAYWNASLLLTQNKNNYELMHAEEFKGMLKYDTISGAFGNENKIGFTLARIGISGIKLTKLPNEDEDISPTNKPYSHKTVYNADYILYMGFARAFGNFPIGISPKLVYRDLAGTTAFGFGADIATHYKAHERLMLAMRIRDVIPTQIYWSNGTKESAYIGFDAEARVRLDIPIIDKALFLFANGEINTEGIEKYSTVNVGDVSLDPHFGAEFILHDRVSLLAGYDIEFFTAGVAVNYQNFLLNYSFEQNPELENSHRFSIGYSF